MIARTTRRSIVRAGAAALAIPFLPLVERRADAAITPRRLLIVATPNGTIMDAFLPSDLSGLGEILRPLEPFRKKMIVMRGLNMSSAYKAPIPADHGPDFANGLTGRQRVIGVGPSRYGAIGGISLDQHVANAIGSRTKFASLQFGIGEPPTAWPLMARAQNQPIWPEINPRKAFDRVFGALMPGAVDPMAERVRADRQSVLDYLKDDLADLRCQIGTQERYKLDAHLESIREVERSLSFTSGAASACKAPAPPGTGSMDFPTTGKVQMDLVTATLACDLTRVIVLMWSGGGSNVAHTWIGIPAGHHNIAHDGSGQDGPTRRAWMIRIETWYAQQLAYLLGKMDSVPDGAGTLLDSTAVVWIHEQANGSSHDRRNMPYVIAGGCGGFFRTGQLLKYNGTHHNNLLVSLMNAMEVPGDTFGDPAYCTGPLPELR